MVWLGPPFVLSSVFVVVEMTTQTRMPGGNFHRAFCFNSVKMIFLCSMSCLSDRTDSTCRTVQKIALFWIALWTDLSLLWNTKKHISFLPPWNAVTRLKQQIAVTNIQLVTSRYIFSRYFSTFWIFFCAKECYKQANLENKTQHVIVIIDNFKGQR